MDNFSISLSLGSTFAWDGRTWQVTNLTEFVATPTPGRFYDLEKRKFFHCDLDLPNDGNYYILVHICNIAWHSESQALLFERDEIPVTRH